MATIAFGIPVKEGKTQEARKFIDELLGDKQDHHHSRQKDRGYKRIQVFHQTWPVEQFVMYMEADDLAGAMKGRDGDAEKFIQERYEALTGHHVDHIQPHVSELIMDWHEEKGASRKHHG